MMRTLVYLSVCLTVLIGKECLAEMKSEERIGPIIAVKRTYSLKNLKGCRKTFRPKYVQNYHYYPYIKSSKIEETIQHKITGVACRVHVGDLKEGEIVVPEMKMVNEVRFSPEVEGKELYYSIEPQMKVLPNQTADLDFSHYYEKLNDVLTILGHEISVTVYTPLSFKQSPSIQREIDRRTGWGN